MLAKADLHPSQFIIKRIPGQTTHGNPRILTSALFFFALNFGPPAASVPVQANARQVDHYLRTYEAAAKALPDDVLPQISAEFHTAEMLAEELGEMGGRTDDEEAGQDASHGAIGRPETRLGQCVLYGGGKGSRATR
jgi:hypothetical protein